MKLITYQNKEVIDQLFRDGEYKVTCPLMMRTYNNFEWKGMDFNPFKEVYQYMICRMKKLIDNSDYDETIIAPIWCWFSYKSLKKLNNDNKNLYRIELEIEDNKALLSDFYIYENIAVGGLSYIYNGDDEKIEAAIQREKSEGIDFIYDMYDVMLDISKAEYVQATIWKINRDMVKSIVEVKTNNKIV